MPRAESAIRLVNLSTTERDAITNWESGDVVFNTTTLAHEFYNGSIWISISTNAKTPGFISCPFITASLSYQVAPPRFIYGGTDSELDITKVEVILYLEQNNVKGSVRLYDLTNANVIAEVTNVGITTPSIIDLGIISNLPTSEAIFEIQVKRETANPAKNIFIDSASISYT